MKEAIQTKSAPSAIGPYSQAVKTGNLLFISGQIPLEPNTMELITGNTAAQAERCLINLKAIIEEAGLTMDNIVKTQVFLKNMDDFQAVNEVYAKFFKSPYPARAAVEVSRLPKDVSVEIEAIASFE